MKKLLSTLLALIMVFSLATVAFAATSWEDMKDQPAKISVTYKPNSGTAPAETFSFTFTAKSAVDNEGNTIETSKIPAISGVSVEFDSAIATEQTKEASVTIDASKYDLGVYKYEVAQTKGSKAGVNYTSEKLYLVVTILRDESSNKHYVAAMRYETESGTKTNGVTNTYDSGSLKVTKKITGNNATMSDEFDFTITFTADDGVNFTNAITSNNANGAWDENNANVYKIKLGDNGTVTLSYIPAGVKFEVTEDKGDYDQTVAWATGNDKKADANETESVVFTNNRDYSNIDTGVITESAPYILLIAVCAVAAVLFVTKRRRVEF